MFSSRRTCFICKENISKTRKIHIRVNTKLGATSLSLILNLIFLPVKVLVKYSAPLFRLVSFTYYCNTAII